MSRARDWSTAEALAARVAGQGLERRAPRTRLLEVCGAIGGAQAQVGSAARLSLAARVAGVTDEHLRAAVDGKRSLVKTWTVRGTLHLVPARDLPLYIAAFGRLRRESALRWLARSGMSAKTVEALCADILEALADGPLNRKQVAARVGDAHGAQARRMLENSWGGIFHCVTNLGLVVFGPAESGQTTFVRVDQWLGAPLAKVDPAQAEAELARRFLKAYGPATVRDFGYWAGLYAPDAARMWDRIADERREVTVEGRAAFVHASVRRPIAVRNGAGPHVRLLPHFDAFLLGHRDKAACLEQARYKRVFKSAGWISPVVLVDGRVAGTWAIERPASRLIARVAAFRPLDRREQAGVAAEVEALGTFFGDAAAARYGPPARRRVKTPWTGP
ncbi:MAG: winged helix DNA-binding domain-containing protein [Candidatus Eisenbacteria bacterium]